MRKSYKIEKKSWRKLHEIVCQTVKKWQSYSNMHSKKENLSKLFHLYCLVN